MRRQMQRIFGRAFMIQKSKREIEGEALLWKGIRLASNCGCYKCEDWIEAAKKFLDEN